jgi:hypothetical protein
VREQSEPDPLEWEASQVRHTGKIRTGSHLDPPVRMRHLPKHVLFTNPGIEGLEWFISDNIWQWDLQLTGVPGTGWFFARGVPDPPRGIELSIHPLLLSRAYELPKGGAVTLTGSYVFDYYLAFPVLEDQRNELGSTPRIM